MFFSANMDLYSIFAGGGLMYIHRTIEDTLLKVQQNFKVALITGPRQVGKSTVLKHLFGDDYEYVTLDDLFELNLAKEDPKLFFMNHPGKLIIDEVQYAPELFIEIKRLVDQNDDYGQYILTGSQGFSLMRNISESLAGRVGIIEMNGLSTREIVGDDMLSPFIPNKDFIAAKRKSVELSEMWRIIQRGSLPELYKNENLDWEMYYASYVKTYIERDVRDLLNVKDLNLFSQFLTALAARTAQILNYNTIANEIGVDLKTIKSWISVLEASGIIYLLQPFSNNRLTRVIKTPMLYFKETGLVCYLLKWKTPETLMNGAMSGEILETFVISEIIKSFNNAGITNVPIMFYRDRDMKEIDIIIEKDGVLYPVEIKKTSMPTLKMAKNMAVLEKAEGFSIGNQIILSFVQQKSYLAYDTITYPIYAI